MRYELRRRLETISRALAELGERDNALARRLHDGTAVSWLRGEYGEHVCPRRAAALAGERAYGEAEALLARARRKSARAWLCAARWCGRAATVWRPGGASYCDAHRPLGLTAWSYRGVPR